MSAEVSQDTAQRLFIEGAFLICLNVPQGTAFGLFVASIKINLKAVIISMAESIHNFHTSFTDDCAIPGIDYQAYVVGPNFMGVKMIPPGPHFVNYRCANNACSHTH